TNHYQDGTFGSIRIARNIHVTSAPEQGSTTKADLFINGTGDKNDVSVSADVNAKTTTVITDGRTQVFDHLFSDVNIFLGGKHSHFKLDLPGSTIVVVNVA